MKLEQSEELGAGGLVVVLRKAVRILKDTTANHKAIELGIFFVELERDGAVFDVAVDEELGLGGVLGAELENLRDEFVVRRDFGHLFASAEMDGERGGMFFEDGRKPSLIFINEGEAKAGFDRDRKSVGAGYGVAIAGYGEVWRLNHSGAATGFVDMFVGATKVEVDTGKAEIFQRGGELRKMVGVFAPNLSDNRSVRGGDFEAVERIVTTFFASKGGDVGKLREKEIRTGSGGNDGTKGRVGDAFHRGEGEDRFLQLLPDVHNMLL